MAVQDRWELNRGGCKYRLDCTFLLEKVPYLELCPVHFYINFPMQIYFTA